MPINKPFFINTDSSPKDLKGDEAMFLKDVQISINKNSAESGTANPSLEGQNEFVLTPIKSLTKVDGFDLPSGYNKNVGTYKSVQTNEVYSLTYNENGQHCIHVISGDTGVCRKVIQSPYLELTDNQEDYVNSQRATIRVIRDSQNNIVEKILMFTNYSKWQKWILVESSIATSGFNPVLFPYWEPKPPHFDFRELVEWAVRPPMINPIVSVLANTPTMKGIPNRILDIAFEFCIDFIYTDGRETTVSPWSLPLIVKTSDFLSNPDLIPKRAELTLPAGSPMVEKINIYFRQTVRMADSNLQRSFSDWQLYDTIYKFNQSKNNVVMGTQYWLRTNPWANYSYDPVQNTIKYIFDNNRLGLPVAQVKFRVQSDMPQLSAAMCDLGDSVALWNNRHQYNNFSSEVCEKIGVQTRLEENNACSPPLRTVTLYCFVGRERLTQSYSDDTGYKNYGMWLPQVGYHAGDDEQARFGGIYFESEEKRAINPFNPFPGASVFIYTLTGEVKVDLGESRDFQLDFADRKGFRCYAKGTPYYADCTWAIVDKNGEKTSITGALDVTNPSDLLLIKNTYLNGGYFVGEFKFTGLPADRYTFCLGRHNVPSDEDYRGQSTYVMGIADSERTSVTQARGLKKNANLFEIFGPALEFYITTVTPSAIVNTSKEIFVDCTNGDVDTWRNGSDLFYIFCPFKGNGRDSSTLGIGGIPTSSSLQNPMNRWSFNEGYMLEDRTTVSTIPIELFPYESTEKDHYSSGTITDKNGFWFTYQWGDDSRASKANIRFYGNGNCSNVDFVVPNNRSSTAGWKPNNIAYFSSYNDNIVGVANYVLIKGLITSTGGIPFSRIAISIHDGATAYTDQNGEFTLVVHNFSTLRRVSQIYINPAGNFTISMPDCQRIPLFTYDETSSYYPACRTTGVPREYGLNINLQIDAQSGEFSSVKRGASYVIGLVGHDLAGRQTFVNRIAVPAVPSIPQTDNYLPAYFQWVLTGLLRLNQSLSTADIAWLSFYVSEPTNYRKYLQYVFNSVEFIDQNGNVTNTPSNASLVRLSIQSLLDSNIQSNFTLLSNYQFVINDRLRIFDDGDGNLFDTATYGDVIDVEIQGTNYNQAAINANLILPPTNTVLSSAQSQPSTATTLYVKYDSRFDKLQNKEGGWIELYTPELQRDVLTFGEASKACYPVINGELQQFVSGNYLAPVYQPITTARIEYWDTYQFRRTIVGLGKYVGHPFESPNVTDTWGVNLRSSGRPSTENADARQQFFIHEAFKSLAFITGGQRNGLGTFIGSIPDTDNRKSFKRDAYGGVTGVYNEGSIVFVLCERNWFITDYNMIFVRSNEAGQFVAANLTDKLGEPHQKLGSAYGMAYKDVATFLVGDKWIGWHDSKNACYLISDFRTATDITELRGEDGRLTGIASYYNSKCEEVERWNIGKSNKDKYDIVAGFDDYLNKLYITFRPRRNNTRNKLSFVNKHTDFKLASQETLVFDMDIKRWVRTAGFTPEGYGGLNGAIHSQEFLSFANGVPYFHNAPAVDFLNFYSVYCRPVIKCVVNDAESLVKVLKSLSLDTQGTKFSVLSITSEAKNLFSWLGANHFEEREKMEYAAVLRNANTYPPIESEYSYRSMIIDGNYIYGSFLILTILPELAAEGKYFEVAVINSELFASVSNKKQQNGTV